MMLRLSESKLWRKLEIKEVTQAKMLTTVDSLTVKAELPNPLQIVPYS